MDSTLSLESTTAERNGKIAKTITYYSSFIVLGLITGIFGPTLPDLAKNTQTSLDGISIIFVARSIGYLLGSFLSGRFFDRAPAHPLLGIALVITAATFVLIPITPSLWLLAGIVILLGIAEGSIDVGGNTLLVWVHHNRVAPFMNGLHFFFGVGAFLSPIIIAQVVLATTSINGAFWLLAFLMLPIALWIARLPSPKIEHGSKTDVKPPTNMLLVAVIAIFLFVYVGAETGYGNWIFTYATKLGLSDTTSAAYLTSIFWGSFTLGRLIGVPISARVAPAKVLVIDLVGCLASVALVFLFPQSVLILWIATFAAGLCMASIFPTMIAFAERQMTLTGQINSWFFIGAGLGAMTLPWFIGQLFEKVGAHIMPIVVIVTLVLDLILWGVIVFAPRAQSAKN